MKLEYLASGSTACPLIRLYEFDEADVRKLRQVVRSLSSEPDQDVSLNQQPWIVPIDGCEIKFRLGDSDQGITQNDGLSFVCVLSSDGWENVEGLLKPFCEHATGYQWLIHIGKISLLLSQNGKW